MNVLGGLFLFIVLYIFSIYADKIDKQQQNLWLVILFVVIVFIIGSRSTSGWVDTVLYCDQYVYSTNTLADFSFSDEHYAYSENGFYLLSVISKTISYSPQFYLYFIGFLSMLFLFPSLRLYSPMPFLGLAIYVSRFMLGRDMNQMRGGLAISILMLATMLIYQRKWIKYSATILAAYTIHTSALVALPILILDRLKIGRKTIVFGLLAAFLIAGVFGNLVKDIVSSSEFIQELARSYVEEGNEKAWSNDLTNPLIYYQCAILLLFTFQEKRLAPKFKMYYLLRTGYFYSCLLLIILCQYGIVAGRTSTIFATFEIFMIPMMMTITKKESRWVNYAVLAFFLCIFFIKNWPGTNFGL
jgi:hypothetical protein